jgi:hypothetical protein
MTARTGGRAATARPNGAQSTGLGGWCDMGYSSATRDGSSPNRDQQRRSSYGGGAMLDGSFRPVPARCCPRAGGGRRGHAGPRLGFHPDPSPSPRSQ